MFLHRFANFAILKIFVTDFSGTMKARKLNVPINMDNDWMYQVYPKRDHGSITLGGCILYTGIGPKVYNSWSYVLW